MLSIYDVNAVNAVNAVTADNGKRMWLQLQIKNAATTKLLSIYAVNNVNNVNAVNAVSAVNTNLRCRMWMRMRMSYWTSLCPILWLQLKIKNAVGASAANAATSATAATANATNTILTNTANAVSANDTERNVLDVEIRIVMHTIILII